ncbi:hypothetical protein EDD66_1223 [Mobilisporobacter senegalensis]|uniref:ParB-like nuclease family protein n=1 Tax=Mobilisporobacter senegalensis TaxID=1329262 RepID=A0A3N1X336_9FIRM|nr:hypothetical protein [Mobilisporobacter senegalensis]ROR21216.1 hypothetical protein EDD66_1223 [Mobilisporobacter senegalensis]
MNIQYIDQLNELLTNRRHAIVDISDLWLDEKNPRFASLIKGDNKTISQKDIIEYLIRYTNIEEFAERIAYYGGLYDEVSISCYFDENNRLIVLEGNRRIATCKILLDNSLIPKDLNDNIYIPPITKETREKISKVHVVIYDSSEDTQNYIASKHTKAEVEKWETFEQCNYYYTQFHTNNKLLREWFSFRK